MSTKFLLTIAADSQDMLSISVDAFKNQRDESLREGYGKILEKGAPRRD